MRQRSLPVDASRVAAEAAALAGVRVTELHGPEQAAGAARLFADIWMTGDDPTVPRDILRALEHAGNYVAGAFVGDELVGASAAFFGREHGRPTLHSHITGVRPALQGKRLGFALKQHQRAWALERDIDVVTWTFDALVRRNAFFNLQKLGADVVGYEANFYGRMTDGINVGDESDRCVVSWELTSQRAEDAAAGRLPERTDDDLRGVATEVLSGAESGAPLTSDARSDVLSCWIPEDIVGLRASDPGAALAWRHALRETFGAALRDGYQATGMTRSGRYVLTRH